MVSRFELFTLQQTIFEYIGYVTFSQVRQSREEMEFTMKENAKWKDRFPKRRMEQTKVIKALWLEFLSQKVDSYETTQLIRVNWPCHDFTIQENTTEEAV